MRADPRHPIWPGGPDCTCGQEPWSQYHEGWADARARATEAIEALVRYTKIVVAGTPVAGGADLIKRDDVLGLLRDATYTARSDHYVRWETFGHVCERVPPHLGSHRCRCGKTWPGFPPDGQTADWRRSSR